jgi:pyrroloquinoline quinone biosynthesis protein D
MSTTIPRDVADDSVPRLPRGVRLADSPAQGGMVLLAPERVFKPDAIALAILQRCDGTATVANIADALSEAYNAPRERVLSDVKALLGSLADKQLLEL